MKCFACRAFGSGARSLATLIAVVWSGPTAPVAAQVAWNHLSILSQRRSPAMAYDSARGRIVMFGGNNGLSPLADTWEWDGTAWSEKFPATSPPPRSDHALAFDAARGRVVLFGGAGVTSSHVMADTWEWDGGTWTQQFPAAVPAARGRHALAYDAGRGRVVLFGGHRANLPELLSDTWEWDGSNWVQLAPAVSPLPRSGHATVFDPVRGRLVLFGGWFLGNLSDTWEWDGTNWSQRSPATSPPPRNSHALTYDHARGRVVLFSGDADTSFPSDTWEWDGTVWVQRAPAASPQGRFQHAMAYDAARGRTVLFGGKPDASSGPACLGDTWTWDGTTWVLGAPAASPAVYTQCALAYDAARGRVVLFGGLEDRFRSETWEWDGVRWQERFPATSPSERLGTALTYDAARGRVVLFGGRSTTSTVFFSDTWEWDGTNWLLQMPAASPSARIGHSLAYDAARGRVVLFGGNTDTSQVLLSDTWEWDGTTWSQQLPTTSPAGRRFAPMAFDSARGRMVLFGGSVQTGAGWASDTWEWDGTNWTEQFPPVHPFRVGQAMTYDGGRSRVVLLASSNIPGAPVETWEWDGTQWMQRFPAATPPPGSTQIMVYDSARERTLLYEARQTWEYGPTNPASYSAFGQGCPGSAGTPALSSLAGQRPWLGDWFALELTRLPPGNAALVWLGRSRTAWGPVNLPLDLGFAGLPGCALRTSPEFAFPVFNLAGSAVLSLALPMDGSLLGAPFYNQALVADRAANAFGASLSNAGEGRIGGR